MEIANCRVRLNKVGSDTPVNDITPAEAMLLHILHGSQNGGLTFGEEFSHIKIVGQAMVQVAPALPEVKEPDYQIPAVAEQHIPGRVLKQATPARVVSGEVTKAAAPVQHIPAIAHKPAQGTPGTPGYVAEVLAQPAKTIPAQPEVRAMNQTIPSQPEEREQDQVIPAKPAQTIKGKVIQAAVPAVLRPRTNAEELRRLSGKYNGARTKDNKPIIDTVWPDKLNSQLPNTFREIQWADVAGVAAGVQPASINYATGALATSTMPTR